MGLSENGFHGGMNKWKHILVHAEPVHNFTYPISFKLICYITDVANKILKFSYAVMTAFMDMTFKVLKMTFSMVENKKPFYSLFGHCIVLNTQFPSI